MPSNGSDQSQQYGDTRKYQTIVSGFWIGVLPRSEQANAPLKKWGL
jgi:hypothetical protein